MDTYMRDKLLAVIAAHSPFPFHAVRSAYTLLKSVDDVVEAVDLASKSGIPLYEASNCILAFRQTDVTTVENDDGTHSHTITFDRL